MDKLLNVLLYPAKLYSRLTDRKATLYIGIVLVGVFNLFFPNVIESYKTLFIGKSAGNLQLNILMAVGLILLLGAVDVLFFSVPLFDIFRYFKKREGSPHQASLVKVMKVYIISHFLIIPVDTLFYYVVFKYVDEKSSQFMINLAIAFFFIILIWSSAIVSRGVNTLFNFNPLLRRLAFIIVFTWNFLLGMVLGMQIIPWLSQIFK